MIKKQIRGKEDYSQELGELLNDTFTDNRAEIEIMGNVITNNRKLTENYEKLEKEIVFPGKEIRKITMRIWYD